MLKNITLRNFKSYRSATLPLAPLTVLIGANASGKSNAVEAMRFFSWIAQGQKLSAIRYSIQGGDHLIRGKVDDLSYCNGETFSIGCEVSGIPYGNLELTFQFRGKELHLIDEFLSTQDKSLYKLVQASKDQNTSIIVDYDSFGEREDKQQITCTDQMAIFTQLTSPATFSSDHKRSQKEIPKITKQYEQLLSSMLFLDPVPAMMRGYSFPSENRLLSDCSNLSSALYSLWSEESLNYEVNREEVLQFIQSLPEQDIHSIDFLKEPRGGVMLQLTETFGGQNRTYDASLLSDGTLRVLAIAVAMLSAKEGSLVIIEEIDNGVHPGRAKYLLERIKQIAERRNLRVLLSTHNPAMLDALPDTAIPNVVFCYRNPADGASSLIRLEDVPDYPELIAQGSLGNLVTRGLVDRFVKQRKDPDQKKAKALAWLDTLSQGVK